MHRGEYAFILVTQKTTTEQFVAFIESETFWRNYDENDEKRRQAFSNLFIVRSKSDFLLMNAFGS